MEVQVNWLAVLLAAASSMLVGGIWYAKPVFGTMWQRLVKLDDKRMQEGAPRALALVFLASLVTAYILAHVTYLSNSFFGNSFLQDALTTAFWMWLGFVGARLFVHDLFERRPTRLSMVNVLHELVTLLVMGLVIGLIKP